MHNPLNSRPRTRKKNSVSVSTTTTAVVAPLPSAAELANSIEAIADAMKEVFASRLSKEAIVVLIAAHSRISKDKVRLVLNNLESFDKVWLKAKAEK